MKRLESMLRQCNSTFLQMLIPDYFPPEGESWDPVSAFMDNLVDAGKHEAIEQLFEVLEILLEELENALA